ncbi:proton-coupled zinc antiporter SLC30A2 isoform X2 [Drosophila kikkawai]|uniref:Proton-coupled zinc antiporter SLC30A2 isoform X2 n=1 Tax=Drosophila kikkawai TaxID=30033 RepID=A0ABM4GBU7_DROKI|nr:zinc transporter 2 isoform X2 [Drosophila kikkawai]
MSKYQKLSHALPPIGHEDECDEGFSLNPYFDDNRPDSANPATRSEDLKKYRSSSNGKATYNNSSSSGSMALTGQEILRTVEEQTWEVPLLDDCHDNANYRSEPERMEFEIKLECRSGHPGFGANLKSQSAQEAKFKILLAISLCCIFMVIEFLGGYVAGSLAIIADAAHLASDCISFVIGLVAIWVGGRAPDERMTFGYKRFEVFGALASILGIWVLTTFLVVVAIQRIYSQDFELNADVMMAISGIGIAINIVMIFVLHGSWFMGGKGHGHSHSHGHSHCHSHGHSYSNPSSHITESSESSLMNAEMADKIPSENCIVIPNGTRLSQSDGAHDEKNLNLRAAIIHVIGDLVQSIGVFLAAVLIKFCPSAKYADPMCTLLFSVIVILTTVQLFRESVSILLDAVPPNLCLQSLQRDLSSLEGVRSVHHLNVWQHTSQHRVLMVHLVIDTHSDGEAVVEAATRLVSGSKYKVKHSTIQVERTTT